MERGLKMRTKEDLLVDLCIALINDLEDFGSQNAEEYRKLLNKIRKA